MKKQIRKSIFETNSSSIHSLVIKKNESGIVTFFDNVKLIDGILYLDENDLNFGYEPRILTKPFDKICYLLVVFKYNEYYIEEIKNTIKKLNSSFEDIYINGEPIDEDIYCGYIDHQSDGNVKDKVYDLDVPIEDIIKYNKYVIIMDNDCISEQPVIDFEIEDMEEDEL